MYTNNPRGNPRDAVRLLVGDLSTSTSAEYLSDVDYDFFIAQSGNQWVQAKVAANALAAMFAGAAASASGGGFVEKTVGDLTLKKADATRLAAEYRALSQHFARQAAAGISPYAGGQTISGKRDVEADSDRVRPMFRRGLMDNSGSLDFGHNPSTST